MQSQKALVVVVIDGVISANYKQLSAHTHTVTPTHTHTHTCEWDICLQKLLVIALHGQQTKRIENGE